MPSGSCLCGRNRVSYDDAPTMRGLCHCLDCQKISGSTHSTNFFVPDATFKVETEPGAPPLSTYEKLAESGNKITSHFCAGCGTTLYRVTEKMPGKVIFKAGILEDKSVLNEKKPDIQVFNRSRVNWFPALEGVTQKDA